MLLQNISLNNVVLHETTNIIDAIFASLTVTSSITAYNAASVGTWVPVTSAEYFRVFSTVTGTGVNGMSTPTLTGSNPSGSTLIPNRPFTFAASAASAPAGAYIIGIVWWPSTVPSYFTPLSSTTFEGTYYPSISALITSSTYKTYFIRKAPIDSIPTISYWAFINSQSNNYLTGGGVYAYSTNLSAGNIWGPPWTSYTNATGFFQLMYTTTKQW
jgi:hypothetical protein